MTGFPTLSVRFLHLKRSLQFKYHILTLILYFRLSKLPTCPCIPVTQCEQLIWWTLHSRYRASEQISFQ
jgi:hypothetical protein